MRALRFSEQRPSRRFRRLAWALASLSIALVPSALRAQDRSVSGRVVVADSGDAIPDASILLLGAGLRAETTTDAEGRFQLDDLQPEVYAAMVVGEDGYLTHPILVDLNSRSSVVGVELTIDKPAVISGRVIDGGLRPVAGVRVSVLSTREVAGPHPPSRFGRAETNEAGEYRIALLRPGTYRLMVERPPLPVVRVPLADETEPARTEPALTEVLTYYPSAHTVEEAVEVTLESGQTLEGIDITVARQEAVCVQSRVQDPLGDNRLPVRVRVWADWYLTPGTVAQGVVLGGDGFEVCGLPSGTYRLVVWLDHREVGSRYASQTFAVTGRGVRLPDMRLQPVFPPDGD